MNDNCKWQPNEDGIWFTDCDNAHEFTVGDPDENGYNYCPYCGKRIETE